MHELMPGFQLGWLPGSLVVIWFVWWLVRNVVKVAKERRELNLSTEVDRKDQWRLFLAAMTVVGALGAMTIFSISLFGERAPSGSYFGIAFRVVLLSLAIWLVHRFGRITSHQSRHRRTNHAYIPACYDQPSQEIPNPKSEIPNRK